VDNLPQAAAHVSRRKPRHDNRAGATGHDPHRTPSDEFCRDSQANNLYTDLAELKTM